MNSWSLPSSHLLCMALVAYSEENLCWLFLECGRVCERRNPRVHLVKIELKICSRRTDVSGIGVSLRRE